MNKKIGVKILLSILFLSFSPLVAKAADVEITCYGDQKPVIQKNTNPLFSLESFLPDSTEKREIYIKNKDSENPCKIYLKGKGTESKLGDKITTEISEKIYSNTLSKFLTSKRILIADLKPETEVTRTISLHLDKETNNSLMNQKLSFDLVIESEWGSSVSSDTGDVEGAQDETTKKNNIFDSALEALGIGGGENLIDTSNKDSENLSVLGEDDSANVCSEKTLWWLPLVIQLFLTTVLIYINSSFFDKPFVKLTISILLSVISFFVINKIGCGCNEVWLCTNHWILNILIGILPIFKSTKKTEYASQL